MKSFGALCFCFAAFLEAASSFVFHLPTSHPRNPVPSSLVPASVTRQQLVFLLLRKQIKDSKSSIKFSSNVPDQGEGDEEDEEEVEPGKMRVSEIKAELELRGVTYSDCFDKEALEQRLVDARKSGKADPELLEKFNKQRLEDTFEGRKTVDETLSDDDILKQAVGNDGNLPGGLSPEQFKELVGNPEIMSLLQSTKMQEAMQLMMTGGQEELEAKMKSDPELREIVQKLNASLGSKLG